MKIYIAGKITGERIKDCLDKFSFAYGDIRMISDYEYTPISPLSLPGIHFGISHKEAMKICMRELKTCDAIYMLKDWKESKGAKMEHEKAVELGLKIYYQ